MRVITGKARGIQLKTPQGMLTRPTADRVKEALFSIIRFDVANAGVLDLFGGTGQLGIEALSRGAAGCTFVDQRKEAVALVRSNLKLCQLSEKARVVQGEGLSFLSTVREPFHLIFLDPPYKAELLENALKKIAEIDMLTENGIIICERPVEKALADDFPGLTHWRDYKYGKTAVTIFRKAQRA